MIQHVTFEVAPADLESCVAFYTLLGFARVEPPPSLAERATWVERAGTQVHLMRVEEPVTMPRGPVAVVVERYEETLASVRAAGFEAEPRPEHWGAPRAFVRDPAGNRVELMAFGPPTGRPWAS